MAAVVRGSHRAARKNFLPVTNAHIRHRRFSSATQQGIVTLRRQGPLIFCFRQDLNIAGMPRQPFHSANRLRRRSPPHFQAIPDVRSIQKAAPEKARRNLNAASGLAGPANRHFRRTANKSRQSPDARLTEASLIIVPRQRRFQNVRAARPVKVLRALQARGRKFPARPRNSSRAGATVLRPACDSLRGPARRRIAAPAGPARRRPAAMCGAANHSEVAAGAPPSAKIDTSLRAGKTRARLGDPCREAAVVRRV